MRWVDAKDGTVPPDAFKAGHDVAPGVEALYVCRTSFNGSMQLGKLKAGVGACEVPFGGLGLKFPTYQVLLSGNFTWVPVVGGPGHIPQRTVQGGFDIPPTSPVLYVCQARYQGALFPGKTRNDWDTCSISLDGRELGLREYAALVPGG